MINEDEKLEGRVLLAHKEINVILEKFNCKLSIEETFRDGKIVSRGIVVADAGGKDES